MIPAAPSHPPHALSQRFTRVPVENVESPEKSSQAAETVSSHDAPLCAPPTLPGYPVAPSKAFEKLLCEVGLTG